MSEIKKACVIGYPISHSLSPIIHNYWLKKYNIIGEYTAVEVKPEDFKSFLLSLGKNGFVGCNITLPYKEKAWEIISNSNLSDTKKNDTLPFHVANFMRAVNTVVIDEIGHYVATNTDFIGFARNLLEAQPNYDYQSSIAYVIGAGGAAKAVIFALASMQVKQIVLTNRTETKCFEMQDLLVNNFHYPREKIDIVPWKKRNEVFSHCNLVVNATSLGMIGKDALDIDMKGLPENSLVTDIIYNPLETGILKQAKELGAITVDGLGMLLHQAAPAFEAWFGKKPDVDADLRNAVLSSMGKV